MKFKVFKNLFKPKNIEERLFVYGSLILFAIAITFYFILSAIFNTTDTSQLLAIQSQIKVHINILRFEFICIGFLGFFLCVLCIRRIRLNGFSLKNIGNFIAATITYLTPIILSFVLIYSVSYGFQIHYETSNRIAEKMQRCLETGSLTNQEKVLASNIVANNEFLNTGTILEVYSDNGSKTEYVPSDLDILPNLTNLTGKSHFI